MRACLAPGRNSGFGFWRTLAIRACAGSCDPSINRKNRAITRGCGDNRAASAHAEVSLDPPPRRGQHAGARASRTREELMGNNAWMALGATLFFCASVVAVPVQPDGAFPADPPNREWARIRRFEANSPVGDAFYGEGIALSGDVLAIGAPEANDGSVSESGLVEVWERIDGAWTFAQYLTDPTPAAGGEFGHAIDSCGGGRFIVVGSPGVGRGAAYLFERNASGTWDYVWPLNDSLASLDAQIGYDVAIDCDGGTGAVYAAIGAPFDDVGGTTWAGSVAIWRPDGAGWVRSQRLAPHADVTGARCGLSVDLSYVFIVPIEQRAGRLLFGCPLVDYSGVDSAGVAYLYDRNGTTFSLEQTLGPPDPDSDGEFGTSVSLLSGYAAIGAPWAPHNTIGDAGRVWIFERVGEAPLYWEATELTVDDFFSTSAQYFFGHSVALGSDSRGIYVHAGRSKTLYVTGGRSAGIVETFNKASASAPWLYSDRLASPDIDDGYDILNFGNEIAASGGEVAIGAARSTVHDLGDAGTAFVFRHERVFGGDFERYQQSE